MVRRSYLVLGATAAGLGAVLSFHTAAGTGPIVGAGVAAQPAATPAKSSGGSGSGGSTSGVGSGSGSAGAGSAGAGGAGAGSTASPAPAAGASTTRTVTGPSENFGYGILRVRVTGTASHLASIAVVDQQYADFRSQQISQYAITILHQQAMSAQSANINGVSGATYTSEAYAQSLQGAIDALRK